MIQKLLERLQFSTTGKLNSPSFAYRAVYGRDKFIPGRVDSPKKTWRGMNDVDAHLKDSWLNSLADIPKIELRASCEGHDPEHPAYIIFRLKQNQEYSRALVDKFNAMPGLKSLTDKGMEGQNRIVVAGKVWYGQPEWESWWSSLAEKIKTALTGLKETDDDFDLLEGIRPAFGSPGGKRFLAKKIVSYIPDHKTYVEPFIGGGAVFFAKKPSEKEVINDKDSEIAHAYRYIKNMSEANISNLKRRLTTFSRDQFFKLRDMKIPKDDTERFYRFIYTKAFSYGQKGNSTVSSSDGISTSDIAPKFDRFLKRVKPRLSGVKIRTGDYRQIVKEFDSPSTFFYFDPPYANQILPELGVPPSLEELNEMLSHLKGKFILSIADTKNARQILGGGGKKFIFSPSKEDTRNG